MTISNFVLLLFFNYEICCNSIGISWDKIHIVKFEVKISLFDNYSLKRYSFHVLSMYAILKTFKCLFRILEVFRSFLKVLEQGRPTFFSRGSNLLFQKFGEPKFIVYRFFCQKVGEDQKKRSSLRFDRCFKKRNLWYFSATHNVSAEASIY